VTSSRSLPLMTLPVEPSYWMSTCTAIGYAATAAEALSHCTAFAACHSCVRVCTHTRLAMRRHGRAHAVQRPQERLGPAAC
jgi:ferredoxin